MYKYNLIQLEIQPYSAGTEELMSTCVPQNNDIPMDTCIWLLHPLSGCIFGINMNNIQYYEVGGSKVLHAAYFPADVLLGEINSGGKKTAMQKHV